MLARAAVRRAGGDARHHRRYGRRHGAELDQDLGPGLRSRPFRKRAIARLWSGPRETAPSAGAGSEHTAETARNGCLIAFSVWPRAARPPVVAAVEGADEQLARHPQRHDGGCRGLLPGPGVRPLRAARPWEYRSPGRAKCGAHPGSLPMHGVKATFFTLGWIARRYPASRAPHRRRRPRTREPRLGPYPRRRAGPDAFRADVGRTRRLLEDLGGVPVIGYRAATFSIGAAQLVGLRRAGGEGYRYSSSINPIRHDLYGMPDAPRVPFRPSDGSLWEMPMTTHRVLGAIGLAPAAVISACCHTGCFAAAYCGSTCGTTGPRIFYFHPWEIDPDQPRIAGCGFRSRFRHYTNLSRMERPAGALVA